MQVSQNILPISAAEMLLTSLLSASSGMNTEAAGFSETLVPYKLSVSYYQSTRIYNLQEPQSQRISSITVSVTLPIKATQNPNIATMIVKNFIAEFLRHELSQGRF
jgi:hypothetical protein